MFMVGTDPSAGDDNKIYGIDVVDQHGIDNVLAPDGLPRGKDISVLYEKVMDVSALPRVSTGQETSGDRSGSDMQQTMEITALALSQAASSERMGRSFLFKAARNNALFNIKSHEDLLEFADKVIRCARDDLKTQTKQLRSYMHSRGYGAETIAEYTDSGGLPRLILRSVDHYKNLIEGIIQSMRNFSEGTWKGSYAQAMLNFWAEKLAASRERAVDYRDHVLDTYIVLRDGADTRWQDPSFPTLCGSALSL